MKECITCEKMRMTIKEGEDKVPILIPFLRKDHEKECMELMKNNKKQPYDFFEEWNCPKHTKKNYAKK